MNNKKIMCKANIVRNHNVTSDRYNMQQDVQYDINGMQNYMQDNIKNNVEGYV